MDSNKNKNDGKKKVIIASIITIIIIGAAIFGIKKYTDYSKQKQV